MIKLPGFWTVFEILNNLFEGFLLIWFIDNVLILKGKSRAPFYLFSLLSAGILSLWLFVEPLTLEMAFSDSWIYIVLIIYIALFYRNGWHVKLLWLCVIWIFVNSALSLVYYVFSFMAGLPFEVLLEPNYFRLAVVILSNIVLFLLLYFIVRLYRPMKQREYVATPPGIALFLINLAAITIQEFIFNLYPQGEVTVILFMMTNLLTVFICIMSLVLYKIIYHYAEESALVERIKAQRQEMEKRLEEIRGIYSYVQKTQHDFRKHIEVIERMIADGNTEEGQAYLEEIESKMKNLFSTGCIALDSALTVKEEIMNANGINFLYELCDLKKHPLSDSDFCTIIMNLLDNAIEGISRHEEDLSEGYIRLDIRHIHDMLMIRCENPCMLLPLRKERTRFVSEKRSSGHGLGINIIEDIVKEADGTCSFNQENGTFTAVVNLRYKEGE